MKNIRWISLILSIVMVFALAACGSAGAPAQGGDKTPAQTQTETASEQTAAPAEAEGETETEAQTQPEAETEAESGTEPAGAEDGQNPIMNFIGSYASGRAVMDVEPDGMEGGTIRIHWGSSAWESANWEMSGRLDPETLVLTYDNCRKFVRTYAEDGETYTDTVEYENGSGTVTFHGDDYTVTWEDAQEHQADGMVFTYSYAVPEDADYYAMATAFDKEIVESFAADVRRTVLDENWEALAQMIAYPLTTPDGAVHENAEAFVSYMADRHLSDESRAAFEAETCREMFANYQGVSMAEGRIWFAELVLDGGNLLKIISFSAV